MKLWGDNGTGKRPSQKLAPKRLLPGCTMSRFQEEPLVGHHCGCNACCFCGRAHPEPRHSKTGRRRVASVRREEVGRALAGA